MKRALVAAVSDTSMDRTAVLRDCKLITAPADSDAFLQNRER